MGTWSRAVPYDNLGAGRLQCSFWVGLGERGASTQQAHRRLLLLPGDGQARV